MATKEIKLFFVFSIIFYLLLSFYLVFSVFQTRTEELSRISLNVESYNATIQSSYSVYNSFASDYFLDKTNAFFEKDANLSGLIIYSLQSGPEYIRLRHGNLVKNQPADGTVNSWIPELDADTVFNKSVYSRIFISADTSFNIVYVFNILNRNKVFPILRNTLIATLLHLVFSIIFITLKQVPQKSVSENKAPLPSYSPATIPSTQSSDSAIKESDKATENMYMHHEEHPNNSGMYSDRSGLVWEHFLSEKLDAELKRAASFDQDSCLAFISIDHPSGFIPYKNISKLIIEHFKYRDLAFESGENTFCVIIPEKDIDDGLHEIEKFKKHLLSKFPDTAYRVFAGLTSRNSRLLSEKRMIHEAKAALARAESESVSTTISFRTDLNKYREFIASNM